MAKEKEEVKIPLEFPSISTDFVLRHVGFDFGEVVTITMLGAIKFNNLPIDPALWPPVNLKINTTYEQVEELIKWFREKFEYSLHKTEMVAKRINDNEEKKGDKDE